MSKITKYIVYVDKEVMTKPAELADAVLAHFIKKELDIKKRKQFLALFMKAARVSDKHALAMINDWVQVRDVVGFPFRKEANEVAEAGAHLKKELLEREHADRMAGDVITDDGNVLIVKDGINVAEAGKALKKSTERLLTKTEAEEQDADTEIEGGVPMDDGADEEPESGVASE